MCDGIYSRSVPTGAEKLDGTDVKLEVGRTIHDLLFVVMSLTTSDAINNALETKKFRAGDG